MEAAAFGEWRDYTYMVKTPLPKTGETRQLMTRLLREEDVYSEAVVDPSTTPDEFYEPLFGLRSQLIAFKTYELGKEQRSWVWIVFTSILFEFAVVGLAAQELFLIGSQAVQIPGCQFPRHCPR